MDKFMRRPVDRRGLLRGAAIGAGAVSLGMGGVGYYGTIARAQDATPAGSSGSSFDAAACYQAFPGATTVQYERMGDPPYKIAVSNSYIGNVWRTQMIKLAYAYSKSPGVADLIDQEFFTAVTNDRDDAAQQAAIENMISNGAQAVVILANTPTALVQTVQQARADGIVIVSFDTTVHPEPPDPSIDTGVTVNEDQVEMGRLLAEFLVEQTGGEGKILMVNGVQGTGVDQERRDGAQEVWDANPGISIVEVVGDWDPGKAQTATATALAANPDFAGVWCQGGTDGVVRAFQDAGIPIPPIAGEAENGFRKQMLEYKDEFQGLSIGQSPALVAVSIRAAISLLMGEPVPSAVSMPLPMATTAELEPGVNVFPDAPDNFFTATSIPSCGVNLTFEEIDAQQV
jgi:ribose transport system substrate-binding protein